MVEPRENVVVPPLPEEPLKNVASCLWCSDVVRGSCSWARSFFTTKEVVLLSPHLVSDEVVVLILRALVTSFNLCPSTYYLPITSSTLGLFCRVDATLSYVGGLF